MYQLHGRSQKVVKQRFQVIRIRKPGRQRTEHVCWRGADNVTV
jgi:hypothetical protein